MIWWSVLLGLAASAGFIATNYILQRKLMLTVQFAAILLVATQYAFLGIWSVVAVNLLLIVRNLLFLKLKLNARGLLSISALFAIALIVMSYSLGLLITMSDYIALGAGLFNIAAFATTGLLMTKTQLGLSSFSWTVFNYLQGNWQNMIGDVFGTFAAIAAIYRIRSQNKPEVHPNKD